MQSCWTIDIKNSKSHINNPIHITNWIKKCTKIILFLIFPLGLLTRNNSIDSYEYRNNNNLHKKQVFDAIAAASIVNNCSGVDTSKSQVITLATFTKFLESRQQEKHTDEQIKALIKVRLCGSFTLFLWGLLSIEHHLVYRQTDYSLNSLELNQTIS